MLLIVLVLNKKMNGFNYNELAIRSVSLFTLYYILYIYIEREREKFHSNQVCMSYSFIFTWTQFYLASVHGDLNRLYLNKNYNIIFFRATFFV